MSAVDETDSRFGGDGEGERARKACLTCRRQKMKCIPGDGQACRRCHRMRVQCIFRPRANAASLRGPLRQTSSSVIPSPPSRLNGLDATVMQRLERIESILGINREAGSSSEIGDGFVNDALVDPALVPLYAAVSRLKGRGVSDTSQRAWSPTVIKQLWQSFHEAMPGLHFLPEKQAFTSPTPLLLAAMFYCSSSRGSTEVAQFAPVYYTVLCAEISSLALPALEGSASNPAEFVQDEEWAFQTVLGIILATLLSEAGSRITGVWVSIAHRLLLEYCPLQLGDGSRKWRQLFSGLQILDLEHASIHLCCPAIPLDPPLRAIQMSTSDPLYQLSRMMHVGLTHFAGRGLTTIWSCFSDTVQIASVTGSPLSGVDSAVIRDWARQLDDWLVRFSAGPLESKTERTLVYRQYVMHRLCVLSIYLPSRQFDIFSPDASMNESQELLLSARTTITIHANDTSIWSNWDLIMITWAALIVLQAVKRGHGKAEDLPAIRVHLDLLKRNNEPAPSLCRRLADQLEAGMQDIEKDITSSAPSQSQDYPDFLDYDWSLFDEASLRGVNDFWSVT